MGNMMSVAEYNAPNRAKPTMLDSTQDITNTRVVSGNGKTVLRFSRSVSGDGDDGTVTANAFPIIWAVGSTPTMTSAHADRGSANLQLPIMCHDELTCNGNGVCDTTNACVCNDGYVLFESMLSPRPGCLC